MSARLGAYALSLAAAALLTAVGDTSAQTPSLADVQPGGVVRALVVGIDNYKNAETVPPLGGAVADARDIHQALRKAGVADLTLLIDDQASRAGLESAFSGLARRTGERDLVIVSFAGHGSQGKERVPGSEPDGKDEFFVLWGFGNRGADTRERLLDDEMFDWLGKLSASGARTIFLADVCHGGGLSKAPDILAGRPRSRFLHQAATAAEASRGAYFIAPGEDQLHVPPEIPADDNATRRFPGLTFVAGADDSTTVVEIDIPAGSDSHRGATSYAFARAIEGGADRDGNGNGDGVTTRAELMAFLNREIGRLTGSRQAFVFEPRDIASAKFGLFGRRANAIVPVAPDGLPSTGDGPALAAGGPPSATAGIGAMPALKYVYADQATGNVVSRKGGVKAYGLPPDELPVIAERFEAEERIAELGQRQPLAVSLRPAGTRAYIEGERFAITATGLHGRHLILLNLASGGQTQFLFPRGDVSSLQTQDIADFTIEARAPFGTDAMVVIATERKSPQLEAELASLDGKSAPLKVWDAVARHLKAGDRLGLVSYKTRARN